MSRREFMEQLNQLLSDIPAKDREEALDYYESYFEDAGAENEAEVIRELGSPGRIASEVRASLQDDRENGEFTDRGYEDKRFRDENALKKRKTSYGAYHSRRKGSTILIVILAIVTFPLWAALLGAAFSVVVGILGALFGLIVGALAGGAGLLIAGVALAVIGVPYMATSMGLGIAALGAGMMGVAGGIVLLIAGGWFTFKALPAVVRAAVDLVRKLIFKVKGE